MSAPLLGALAGALVAMALLVVTGHAGLPARRGGPARNATRVLLDSAGVAGLTPARLRAVTLGLGLLVAAVVAAVTGSLPVALAFALPAAGLPRGVLRRRAAGRRAAVVQAWPDVVDNLASAVRAGLSLTEAVAALASSAPPALRPGFAAFADQLMLGAPFSYALGALADELRDPVADRVVEALRLAREVGGTELGGLLRTLSGFLRDDARTRAEVAARQGWTVGAARVAVAGPWAVLLLLGSQPTTRAAYDRPAGFVVLACCGAVCWVAYRWMRRLGRLPDPAGFRTPK